MTYIRFQSTNPDADGRHQGVFGLVNTLARSGRLTPEQEEFRRTTNAWYDANFPNPGKAVYDQTVNPGATAWFKHTAQPFLTRVEGYLDILRTHHIDCERLVSQDPPGTIVYEDDHQVVVIPRSDATTTEVTATA